eukprot:CAMPEP_0119119408 /NCGR_PEP_ID=MMETSP1310-20130426/898_1 /TAXON_ID=464262 /ORGANISM="Genus nov. species nov., Strain RCC2339" /LENGTH=2627 /DNA_ID=CAMNT_0007108843 /DNA_START=120 /DNA_END=8003 /DNA_ORIENTATION=+
MRNVSVLAAVAILGLMVGSAVAGCSGEVCGCESCLDGGSLAGCFCLAGGWVINEVNPGNNTFVEIVNVGRTRSLKGLSLYANGEELFAFDEEVLVPAGHAVVVYDDWETDDSDPCLDGFPLSTVLDNLDSYDAETVNGGDMNIPSGATVTLHDTDGEVIDTFEVLPPAYPGSSVRATDVVGGDITFHVFSAVSNDQQVCSPGYRSDGARFARTAMSEILLDPGVFDYNFDGTVNTLASTLLGGYQDAFVEVTNQECYNVDISGYAISVLCPLSCPTGTSDCGTTEENNFHVFPAGTVLSPGEAVVVFGGYNATIADTVFDVATRVALFGGSQVQIANRGIGVAAELDIDGRPMSTLDFRQLPDDLDYSGLDDFQAALPCQTCVVDCDESQAFVDADPAITYYLQNKHRSNRHLATFPLVRVISGVSLSLGADGTFENHCVLGDDSCPVQEEAASPGLTPSQQLLVQPEIISTLEVAHREDGCADMSEDRVLSYKATITNVGDQSAFELNYVHDSFDSATSLVVGSVQVNGEYATCDIVAGNTFGDTEVQVIFEEVCICAECEIEITYDVVVQDTFPCEEDGIYSFIQQASLDWLNGDDTSTVTSEVYNIVDQPTSVDICLNTTLVVEQTLVEECSTDLYYLTTVTNVGDSDLCSFSLSIALEGALEDDVSCSAQEFVPALLSELPVGSTATGSVVCGSYPEIFPNLDAKMEFTTYAGSEYPDEGRFVVSGSNVEHYDRSPCLYDELSIYKYASCGETECCVPGDYVYYNVTFWGSGNRLVDLHFDDPRDPEEAASLVLGEIYTSGPTEPNVIEGDKFGDEKLVLRYTDAQPGYYSIRYSWLLHDTMPVEFDGVVTNQANISLYHAGENVGYELSSSVPTVENVPTDQCVIAGPKVDVSKACVNENAQNHRFVHEVIEYDVKLVNSGDQGVFVTSLADHFDKDIVNFYEFTTIRDNVAEKYLDAVEDLAITQSADPEGTISLGSQFLLDAGASLTFSYTVTVKSVTQDYEWEADYSEELGLQVRADYVWGHELAHHDVAFDNTTDCGLLVEEPHPVLVASVACANEDPVEAGDYALFTVTVSNDPAYGSNVYVEEFEVDIDPVVCAGVGIDSFDGPDSDYEIAVENAFDRTVLVSNRLAVEETVVFTYRCQVNNPLRWDEAVAAIPMVISHSDGHYDGHVINVTADGSCALGSPVALTIEKTCNSATAAPGDWVHMTIQVLNTADRSAGSVVLSDLVDPAEFIAPYECAEGLRDITYSVLGEQAEWTCDYESFLGSGLNLGEIEAHGGCRVVDFWLQVPCPAPWGTAQNFKNTASAHYLDVTIPVDDDCDTPYLGSVEDSSCGVDIVSTSGFDLVEFYKATNLSTGILLDPYLYTESVLPYEIQQVAVRAQQVISYEISFFNFGNQIAEGLVLEDCPSDQSSLVPGSVYVSYNDAQAQQEPCSVWEGNCEDDTCVKVYCPAVPGTCGDVSAYGNSQVVVSFDVKVADSVLANDFDVCNQAEASCSEDSIAPIKSDDPSTAQLCDATCLPATAKAEFDYRLECTPETAGAGDVVACVLEAYLATTQGGFNQLLQVDFDPNFHLVAGSVVVEDDPDCPLAPKRTVCEGNYIDNDRIVVFMGDFDYWERPSYTINFKATVQSPFDASISEGGSVGLVATIYQTDLASSEPACTADIICDVEEFYVPLAGVNAAFEARLTDALSVHGGVRPGDLIQYTATVSNVGNAHGNFYIENLLSQYDANECVGPVLELVQGSVDTDHGSVSKGNLETDADVNVWLGTLAPWETATVIFDARVADPFPCRSLEVVTQMHVTESYLGGEGVSDDPRTIVLHDATSTPADAAPLVSAVKSVFIEGTPFVCADGEDPVAEAGDVLTYTLLVINDGSQAVFDVNVVDCLDDSLQLLPKSVKVNGEWAEYVLDVDTGDAATNATRTFSTTVGAVPGHSQGTLVFSAVVTENLRSSTITNQALVDGAGLEQFATTAGDGLTDVPTELSVNAVAHLDVTLEYATAGGVDEVLPGDTVQFVLNVSNVETSTGIAEGVEAYLDLDEDLHLVLGSVWTSHGEVLEGNALNDENVRVWLGELPVGAVACITFEVNVAEYLDAATSSISSQAVVTSDNAETTMSRDPSNNIVEDPTVFVIATGPGVELSNLVVVDGRTLGATDGVVPGERFVNVLTFVNNGTQEASNVHIRIEISEETAFEAGSVYVEYDGATVDQGNFLGDSGPIDISLGSFPAWADAEVRFAVTLNSPFGSEEPLVVFPVLVTSDNLEDTLLSVEVSVLASPVLGASLQCTGCANAGQDCSVLQPGSVLRNRLTVTNAGNQDAFDVFVLISPDDPFSSASTAYQVEPEDPTLQSISNPSNNGSLVVSFAHLAGGESISFGYDLVMGNVDSSTVSTGIQAVFISANDDEDTFSGAFSCSDSTSSTGRRSGAAARSLVPESRQLGTCGALVTCGANDLFHINSVEVCQVSSASLYNDNDNNGVVSTGDELQVSVAVQLQSSCANMEAVRFFARADPTNARLVVGTVRTTLGEISSGNGLDDSSVLVNLGNLPGRQAMQVAITYRVQITGAAFGFSTLDHSSVVSMERYGSFEISEFTPEVSFVTDADAFSSASTLSLSVVAVLSIIIAILF